jgi:ribosomal protein L37AE/L43A
MSDERVSPQHCPYCGEQDLRPPNTSDWAASAAGSPSAGAQHGAWECRSCTRVFAVKFLGLVVST